MARQSGFFSWWFGELREVFSGRPVPVYALALSEKEVALIEKGNDTPLGVVDISAHDWREQIEGLRSKILKRNAKSPEIEVQLPIEQVMFTKIEIPNGNGAEAALHEQLQKATGLLPSDVIFDIARGRDTAGKSTVAIAPVSTVEEAARYALEWGFQAVRITSIESPKAFRRGPDFEYGETRVRGSRLPKIAAGMAILALCLSAAATMRLLNVRASLAEQAIQEAASLAPPSTDLEKNELTLGQFAHAAAIATDARNSTLPMWRIIAEITSVLPGDVVINELRYEAGQLRISGTATSIETLSDAMDRSAIFNAPYFPETRARQAGRAKFIMDVTVDERSVR